MIWNRNMLLMDIRRTSGSLLMTFWKIFKIGMTFFHNYRKKSSATRKFWKKVIPVLKIFQKVIRSEPEVRLISINNIFRFQNILIVIFESKFISVDFKEKKQFFFKILNEISKKNFFSFENRKIENATYNSIFFFI